MSIEDLKLDTREKSGTGTVTAKLNKDYVTDKFAGEPSFFVTNRKNVALQAIYQLALDESFQIHLIFDANIKKGRHEFSTQHFPSPFSFSHTLGSTTKGYTTATNAGFIDIENFDIDKGTFRASFYFTFTDFDTREVHQVYDGKIDVKDLEIDDE